jgi:nitrite reductase (NADH) small subunit
MPAAKFVSVARVDDIPAGTIACVEADGEAISLVNLDGRFYALQKACQHLKGPTCEGRIERERYLTCPWHGWKYDVETGKNDFDLAIETPTFEVRVENGEVQVALHTEPG